ncbi:MAG: GtrA family protein [Actinobacteria bacterium]|nr:MAG: GtrA family protein [Actinomycetota bacterium]
MVDRVRFVRFGVVGIINTLITMAVFNLAAVLLHAPALAANALGWVVGFANSYFWNRRWTFADRTGAPAGRSLWRFAVANVVALATSSAVIAALQTVTRSTGLGMDLSAPLLLNIIEAVAIVASLAVNYTLATLWAFRETPAA